MPKANELIVQALEEAGVEYVFGIPGGGTGQIYDLLHGKEDRIKTILVRHEQTAAIMADAYARATGKPAVVMGQGLFIGSNATFGIMESMLSSSPMLVLTDTSDGGSAQHPANQSGAGEYGSIDLQNIFKAMTKYTTLATNPKEAVLGTQLALKHATSGRPGPACVVMRSASISGEVDLESPPFIHPTGGYLNTSKPQSAPQDIERAVEILAGSRRPVLVAGNGVHVAEAHRQLQELAELWNMPVATSYKGKSAISETHPLSLGMVGIYGQAAANQVVGEADTVVIVGAKLSPQDTVRESPNVFNPRQQHIIQIDIDDRNAGWTFPIELGLTGDAAAIMDQLLAASTSAAAGSAGQRLDWASGLPQKKQDRGFYRDPALEVDTSPVTPQRLVATLQETLPDDTVFTLDAGNNRTWMAHFYQAQATKTFFAPGGTAGMGWGLPAAVALKLAYPDRQVCSVTGDGGYMMTVNALSTAVQYNLPLLCVVFNDSALGMVLGHQQPGREIASEFVQTDNGAVARGMGAFGIQVNDSRDLPDAIRQAQASGLPAVVDVIVDRGPSPDDWRADLRTAGET
jgi:acetolactate synthase-1/2/3 large subunit